LEVVLLQTSFHGSINLSDGITDDDRFGATGFLLQVSLVLFRQNDNGNLDNLTIVFTTQVNLITGDSDKLRVDLVTLRILPNAKFSLGIEREGAKNAQQKQLFHGLGGLSKESLEIGSRLDNDQ